jgi:hypothetical protein
VLPPPLLHPPPSDRRRETRALPLGAPVHRVSATAPVAVR